MKELHEMTYEEYRAYEKTLLGHQVPFTPGYGGYSAVIVMALRDGKDVPEHALETFYIFNPEERPGCQLSLF